MVRISDFLGSQYLQYEPGTLSVIQHHRPAPPWAGLREQGVFPQGYADESRSPPAFSSPKLAPPGSALNRHGCARRPGFRLRILRARYLTRPLFNTWLSAGTRTVRYGMRARLPHPHSSSPATCSGVRLALTITRRHDGRTAKSVGNAARGRSRGVFYAACLGRLSATSRLEKPCCVGSAASRMSSGPLMPR